MPGRAWVAVGCLVIAGASLRAQAPPVVPLREEPRESERQLSVPKLRLFGLHSDLLTTVPDPNDPAEPDDGSGCELQLGEYYPYLDPRRPGDPTTMGYTKMFTRYSLMVNEKQRVSLNLLTLTPAGQQSGGLANGPSYVSPALAWTHDLDGGQALHGFVGQNIHADHRWRHNLDGGFLTGIAWQTPIPYFCDGQDGVYFFMQAQAAYRNHSRSPNDSPFYWDVFPGITCRFTDACWFSMGASRLNILSLNWQY